jgi:hypothetical protein
LIIALIKAPITVVIEPITELIWGGTAGHTGVEEPLIDLTVEVIVFSITELIS